MKSVSLQLPTLAFVVSTRAALAAGIGLLVSERIPADKRKKVGAFLVTLGAITTIPAVWAIARNAKSRTRDGEKRAASEHTRAGV